MPRHCDWLLIFIAAAGAQREQNLTSYIPARTAALINNTQPAAAPRFITRTCNWSCQSPSEQRICAHMSSAESSPSGYLQIPITCDFMYICVCVFASKELTGSSCHKTPPSKPFSMRQS